MSNIERHKFRKFLAFLLFQKVAAGAFDFFDPWLQALQVAFVHGINEEFAV